ncbi:MAG TPA: type II and III secretion system protein, partial [Thermotogota bacterium]|nr:type II and III secretion system protein [Thermotogota bacterium]
FKKPEYVEVINVSQELMAKEADIVVRNESSTNARLTNGANFSESETTNKIETMNQDNVDQNYRETNEKGKGQQSNNEQQNEIRATSILSGKGEVSTYIAERWPSITVSAIYSLNLFILRGYDAKDIAEAVDELKRLDWETANETVYSELAFFEYLEASNISLIWEQFYMKHNVKIIFIESLNVYKFYGPEKYVRAFVDELDEIDVDRIIGQPDVQTELVRINITSLTQEEVEKLVSIKIPGVVIERFDVAGYFVTGTQEQINKTKDFLNTLTSDFIEDSSILQLARGVSFETVAKVLALYFSEKDLQVLDLTDPSGSNTPRFLIKGQKERTDNAKLILRSFEMIENTDGAEPPYVHTLDFRKISENTQKEWSTDDILQILYTSYPGVKVNFLPSTQTFLFVGRKSDILAAVSEIESLPQKPSVSRIFTFSNSKHPFQNPQTGEKYTVEELQILLKERYPEVKFTLLEDGSRFSTLELYGKESAVTSCFALLTNVYPPVIINEDKKTFNLQATGQETQEITDIIAKNLQPRVNVYIPQNSPVSDYPSYNYSPETVKSTQTCSFHLENLRWDDWLNILRRVYNYKIDTYSTNGQTLTILIPPGMAYETGSEEIRVLRADYGYEEALNLIQSPIFGGKGYMDKEKGFVVFSGISDIKMEQFMNHLFEVVRQTPPMVEIKVLIVDDNLLGDFQTGANITLSASPLLSLSTDGGLNFNASLLDMANTTKILESITRNLQFNLSLKGKDSDEDSFLKTAPYLSTLSGKTATIRIGESVNFIKETLVGTLTESQTVTFNPGYNLSITPSVRSDETILLKVNINISNQTVNLISNADYSENSRNVQTEVILLNGETLIIGGLEGTGSTTSMTKVPFLGDLPFLGQFFRKEGKNEVTRSVSLFITPSIKYVEPQKPRITVENINLNAIGYLK